jgi:phosphatidylserine decarboxylase
VARRIVTYAAEGMESRQGEDMGFIKFGSRVDLLLPLDTELLIKQGDIVKGGMTHIAKW